MTNQLSADILEAIEEEEQNLGLEVEGELAAFMKAEAQEGNESSIVTEFVLRMLGLGICSDTAVGNSLRPACSPGQKKRVSTGIHLLIPFHCW